MWKLRETAAAEETFLCFLRNLPQKVLTGGTIRVKLTLPLKGFIFLCSFLKTLPYSQEGGKQFR